MDIPIPRHVPDDNTHAAQDAEDYRGPLNDVEILTGEQVAALRSFRNRYKHNDELPKLKSAEYNGIKYRVGRRCAAELLDGSFVGIRGIFQIQTSVSAEPGVYINGPLYKRTRKCEKLGNKRNEVAMYDDSVMMPLKDAIRPRSIIHTNSMYPTHNTARKGDEDEHPLVCRWKVSTEQQNDRGSVTRLLPHEVMEDKFRTRISALRKEHCNRRLHENPRSYAFGDAFSGAGGVSRGAQEAGFRVQWGFDHDEKANQAYSRNFPEATAYYLNVDEFLRRDDDLYVDVLHISPPCQPHSQAHTTPGKDDDANEAAGLSLGDLINRIQPRMVTLEQTYGILKRELWFPAYVELFTSQGYSVKWDVLHVCEFGVPQTRKRLIMLAAGPGELLPDFPRPTHQHYQSPSLDPGLLPPPTVRDAIGFIPPNTSHHDPIQFLLPELQTSKVHWEGQVNTLKTKGLESGCDVHPNGNRKFTPRELACFQSFPFHHTFAGSNTEIKKQIGNAVPPLLAKAILTEVRKALEYSDLLKEEPNLIMIVDDDINDSGDDVIEYIPQNCVHGC